MESIKNNILSGIEKKLVETGENIKLARLRRKLSLEQVAERAGISRPTLSALEKGSPGVSVGVLIQVLFALGLEKDILQLAKDDIPGRKLQDAQLLTKQRQLKRNANAHPDFSIIRPALFWDTKLESISWQKQKKAVIKRVFERGNEQEKAEIIRYYGKKEVDNILRPIS